MINEVLKQYKKFEFDLSKPKLDFGTMTIHFFSGRNYTGLHCCHFSFAVLSFQDGGRQGTRISMSGIHTEPLQFIRQTITSLYYNITIWGQYWPNYQETKDNVLPDTVILPVPGAANFNMSKIWRSWMAQSIQASTMSFNTRLMTAGPNWLGKSLSLRGWSKLPQLQLWWT